MGKEDYIKIVSEKLNNNSRQLMLNQIEKYYNAKEYALPLHTYKIGDLVKLPKGTLLHGTYKNISGLKEIVKNGLICSVFSEGRLSKYPSSVGVWNLKKDYLLKDYINFYSGGTIMYYNIYKNNKETGKDKTSIIPYNKMNKMFQIATKINCHKWFVEQTKEARFMPSLVQDRVQISIIINGNNKYSKSLLKGDILDYKKVNDKDVEPFVNKEYYPKFLKQRRNKGDFFTDRESAILFGVPSNLIEGILVGRNYEKDSKILNEIKKILPNCYISNLDGRVIF